MKLPVTSTCLSFGGFSIRHSWGMAARMDSRFACARSCQVVILIAGDSWFSIAIGWASPFYVLCSRVIGISIRLCLIWVLLVMHGVLR